MSGFGQPIADDPQEKTMFRYPVNEEPPPDRGIQTIEIGEPEKPITEVYDPEEAGCPD